MATPRTIYATKDLKWSNDPTPGSVPLRIKHGQSEEYQYTDDEVSRFVVWYLTEYTTFEEIMNEQSR